VPKAADVRLAILALAAGIILPHGSGWRWSAPGSARGWAAPRARCSVAPGWAPGPNWGRRPRRVRSWARPCGGDGGGAGGSLPVWGRATERGWRSSRSARDAAACSPSARGRPARTTSRSRPWPARQAGWRARSAGTGGAARRNAPRPAARRTWRDTWHRDRCLPGPAAIQASGPGRHRARIGHARGMRRPQRVLRAREEPFKKPFRRRLDLSRGFCRIHQPTGKAEQCPHAR
jgi:hypothetical protein